MIRSHLFLITVADTNSNSLLIPNKSILAGEIAGSLFGIDQHTPANTSFTGLLSLRLTLWEILARAKYQTTKNSPQSMPKLF